MPGTLGVVNEQPNAVGRFDDYVSQFRAPIISGRSPN